MTLHRSAVTVRHLPLTGSGVPLQLSLARSMLRNPQRYHPPFGDHHPFPEDKENNMMDVQAIAEQQ